MENTAQHKNIFSSKPVIPFLAGSAAVLLAAFVWDRHLKGKADEATHKAGQDTPLSRKWGDGTRDIVEQASWESFPASDAPGW